MPRREIFKILSSYFYFLSALICVPFFLAAYYQLKIELHFHPQPQSTAAFGLTVLICLALAWICSKCAGQRSSGTYRQKEALTSVVLIWFLTPAIGALPFMLTGTLDRFDQAYFEAASGFTTTGATVLEPKLYDPHTGEEISITYPHPDKREAPYRYYGTVKPVMDPATGEEIEGIQAVGKALLFWRSYMQWIGGMGVIVLFVAFLPELGIKGKFLFQTETPGPIKEGVKPRIKETAVQIWKIYATLTLIQVIALLLADPSMSFFDSLTLSLSTISTGGFSVHPESIGFYRNSLIEWIILVFMILGSVNFALYYSILKGKLYRLFDPQLICFGSLLLLLGLFVAWLLHSNGIPGDYFEINSAAETLRIGFFQFASALTSTGFVSAPYQVWPPFIQSILLISMFLGGMSGSTAGGLKLIRFQIAYQVIKAKITSIFSPKSVTIARVGDKEIDLGTEGSVMSFFVIAIAFSTLGTLGYLWDKIDFETAFGLTACMVNNTGMAFGAAASTGSMAFLSPFSSLLSSFLMILGRLEYYAVLALLFPAFWED